MNPKARLKFFMGIIVIVCVVLALFVYLEHSMSRVYSIDGQMQSDSFTVGVGYSGIIEKQLVNDGDYIDAGDPLFELRSPTLAEALKNDEVARNSLLYESTEDGLILISAAAKGRVHRIAHRAGAFVPANTEIATINSQDGLYASAMFVLSPSDYARIGHGSRVLVTLPNGRTIESSVYDIRLDTRDRQTYTTIRARLSASDVNESVFSVGTPLQVRMHLSGQTWYSKITAALEQ